MLRVAALYVDPHSGPYPSLGLVDVWAGLRPQAGLLTSAMERDAMAYAGPHPVVAHPPCGHWGRFRRRCKHPESWRACGPRAVEQVQQFGGVLEHPAFSTLWSHCGLPTPGQPVDEHGGYTVQVNQCDWGHPCVKPTWLYIVGVPREDLPDLPPTQAPTHCMVRLHRNPHDLPELPKRYRHVTPPAFGLWLVFLARRTGEK